MTPRIQAAIEAFEAVRAEPFGDRRVRLHDRARHLVIDLLRADLGADERIVATELMHALLYRVRRPARPLVCCASGSKHRAQRIAKRAQKRNLRRWQRRRGNDATREAVVDDERCVFGCSFVTT